MKRPKGKINVETLIKTYGTLYSETLGIDLESHKEEEIFKWFLASILFGRRISEKIAVKTYNEFVRHSVTTPNKILKTGWDGLVRILDDGGYVRYDFSTATRLIEIAKVLKERYRGLIELYKTAADARDLEKRLQEFKGIGIVTTNIFLRELRVAWPKSNVAISPLVKEVAEKLGVNLKNFKKNTKKFMRLECALFRIGRLEGKLVLSNYYSHGT
jgi:endonuclease III